MENIEKQLQELNARNLEVFTLNDGDMVRLENSVYTAGEYEDGIGLDMRIEDHTADIPFIGEIYYGGKQYTDLASRVFIKEHDIIFYADVAYMVVRLHQLEASDDYSLIELGSLKKAAKTLLDRSSVTGDDF